MKDFSKGLEILAEGSDVIGEGWETVIPVQDVVVKGLEIVSKVLNVASKGLEVSVGVPMERAVGGGWWGEQKILGSG